MVKYVRRLYWIVMSGLFLLLLYREYRISRLQSYEVEKRSFPREMSRSLQGGECRKGHSALKDMVIRPMEYSVGCAAG